VWIPTALLLADNDVQFTIQFIKKSSGRCILAILSVFSTHRSVSFQQKIWYKFQGWQISANSGLNRGLNRFKPSWQKQVFAGFYQQLQH